MRKSDQEALLKEILKRSKSVESYKPIYETLFGFQREFVDDPSKNKTALCSRRAGKTHAAASALEIEALKRPGTSGLYTALTRQSAKRIAWKVFKEHDRTFKLGAKFNNTDLTIEYPNGSDIRLIGINDPEAAEAIRGEKFFGCVLDEAQSYGAHLQYVIEEVITPTLMDLDGWMALIGTPNAACTGPFFDATTLKDSGYANHHWTVLNNPHIPHAAKWLENFRKKKGWSEDNPIYLREYCGQWIRSANSLVYQFEQSRNVGTLPQDDEWRYVIGVDLGYNDATAIVVIAFSFKQRRLFIVDTFERTKMLPSDVAREVLRFDEKYKPVSIVADTGGLGKAIVEEMIKRYGITIKAAEKRNKFEYIELINSDFVEGHLQILPHLKSLHEELKLLQWDEDRKKEDPRFQNHMADAMLYAWRESGHYGYRAEKAAPKFGEPEWMAEHERKLSNSLLEKEKNEWWEK